jgi:hypothetical protein
VKDALLGAALTILIGGVLWLGWGRDAAVAGVVFGALATGIDLVAVAVMRRGLSRGWGPSMGHWAVGFTLRLVGVAILLTLIVVQPDRFPPLPSTIGFLGVLIPLLFFEMRLLS